MTKHRRQQLASHAVRAPEAPRPSAPAAGRPRRWFFLVGLLFVLASVYPAWRSWQDARCKSQVRQAREMLLQGRNAQAFELLHSLPRSMASRADVNYFLAVACRRTDRLQPALEHLQLAADAGWPADDLLRQRKMLEFQGGDFAASEKYLMQLAEQDASDEVAGELYEALAKGLLGQFRVQPARLILKNWIAWRPAAPQPHIWLAEILEQEREWPKAAEEYRLALASEPASAAARIGLARVLAAQNLVAEALHEYAAIQAQKPEDPQALLGAAGCQRRLGNRAAAKAALDQALARQGLDASLRGFALLERGQIALEEKDESAAAQWLREACVLTPGDSRPFYILGQALDRLNKTDDAQTARDRAREIVRQQLEMRDISRQLASQPENAALRVRIARLLLELGRREEAFRWLQTALRFDPTHVAAHAALARYYAEEGRPDLAAQHSALAQGDKNGGDGQRLEKQGK